MKLIELELTNFMGQTSFRIEPNKGNLDIYGDNAAGKTTLSSAFCWLLTGKDASGRADFDIKTRVNGVPLTAAEHSVLGIFRQDNGAEVTLKRTYKEIWTKKKGMPTATFSGHETIYEVDGVACLQKHWQERLKEVCDERLLKLLTRPSYFPEELAWKERRAIIMEICGDIPDADVISGQPSLVGLLDIPEIKAGRSLEDHKTTIKARQTVINRELTTTANFLAENGRGLVPVPAGVTEDSALAALAETDKEISNVTQQIATLNATGIDPALSQALIDANLNFSTARMNWSNTEQKASDALIKRRSALNIEIAALDTEIKSRTAHLDAANEKLAAALQRVDDLRASFPTEEPEYTIEDGKCCSECAQVIKTEYQIAAAKTAFENKLAALRKEGIALKEEGEKHRAVIASSQQGLDQVTRELADLNAKRETITIQIDHRPVWEVSDEYAAVRDAQVRAQAAVEAVKTGGDNTAALADLEEQLAALKAERETRFTTTQIFFNNKKVEDRAEELKTRQRTLSAEFENLESQVYLCDEFTRAKINALEDRINSHFALARFRMFKPLINGGQEECCEVIINGVPYSGGLNTGSRINAGIDIINALSRHFGVSLPIWVDNAEAVTALQPTEAQVIRLIVSEQDKTLRVEAA